MYCIKTELARIEIDVPRLKRQPDQSRRERRKKEREELRRQRQQQQKIENPAA